MKRYFLSLIAFSFLIFQIIFPSQLNAQEPAEWAACKVCHTIGKGRLVGPDLKGVTERRSQEWLIPFIQKSQTMVDSGDPDAVQLFEEYKIPMPDNNLSDEQIINILNFITNYVEPAAPIADATTTEDISEAYQPYSGYGPKDSRWTTALAVLVLLLILLDLSVTKFIRWKWLSMLLLFGSLGFLSKVMYVEAKALGRQEGYSPDQPVWFSHKVHSGQNQIDCIYCHSTAYESKHAAIPGTDVCMNCHNLVTTGTQTGTTEISKIQESWESGKPLEWIQVHNLPDHVWFSHSQHVNVEGLEDCVDCHGIVDDMDRIAQVYDLSMGWCLDCHRDTKVLMEDNDYYINFVKFHEELKSGLRDSITVEDLGGTDCSACHY